MMDLDEAIRHYEEEADRKRYVECGKEYHQLAEWLKELKSLKEKADDIDEVGMANIKLALNDGAVKHIKKICNKSECGKCPYTLKKMSCIFSVCPMDWEVNDEND
jgi:hypothetical protein